MSTTGVYQGGDGGACSTIEALIPMGEELLSWLSWSKAGSTDVTPCDGKTLTP
ncbi:hypothetical protein [Methylobacterium adhaesivum]|uniref:Uncharacterized protein n=1 Tax=Methylobacterium adhaesivum TaxID=333297 RepID=A0ABT8BHL9_9HYPH|nr:hypothetical protein [Methylobacterium adhaesivum]MDN3591586.1 hypothetical protein [Methylobacterium adhaesivum]